MGILRHRCHGHLLSVPSCSSPSLSVVGYRESISGGPSQDIPSSWTCCAASQIGLSLPQSQTQDFSNSSAVALPQFPLVVYHGGDQPFSQSGFPGCGRDPQYPLCRQESLPYRSRAQLEFREPRFTEIDSSSGTLERRSSRGGEPA